MGGFRYQEILSHKEVMTNYRQLTDKYVSVSEFEGTEVLKVDPEGIELLVKEAFREASFYLRSSHLKQLSAILEDPEASENDRFVALELLKNAIIAKDGIFPMCQDTGTAIVIGRKGENVWTGADDREVISKGIYLAYKENNFRYSQLAPLDMYQEVNTKNNLPAQTDIYATKGNKYEFMIMAKGGGSANKTFLYQETKALLSPEKLLPFLVEKMKTLGTSACPPYHLAIVIGGTSAEANLKTVKLASAGWLDGLPEEGNEAGQAFRDRVLEKELLEKSGKSGIGAQYGGKYFSHDIRVVRLPRHGASCPVGIGVSCSADRNIKGYISKEGIFIEELEHSPERFLKGEGESWDGAISIDLEKPMDEIRAELSKHPVATPLLLNGKIVVARDIAHAKINELLDSGREMPEYFKNHIIYYAGPAKTPEGFASGSFGPTTAGRMDSYVPAFQNLGASLVMLAKGNRSAEVTRSCRENGGFYLGSIGGAAARLGKDCITNVETIAYPELGMEAVFLITVKDFPAFIIVDDKGNDFFSKLL